MNAAQYRIVKTITGFPKMDTKKFAKMIKVDHSEVLKVQLSNNFEQYKTDDRPLEDLMSQYWDLFGGKPA